ncbi:MAG: YscO family type III secretion system apparatus protein [bacterium]|nr:YscO family type III secretion system apparatus protein [bacterium]
MAYSLESMLKIRAMREDRAGTELTGARRARTAAERVLQEKADARTSFETTKESRRDRLYSAVMGQVVSMDDLDRVRSAVTTIDEEGVLLEEAEARAKADLEKKDQAAQSAKVRYTMAVKNKAKIDQHKMAWEEEERKLQEMRADAEMEEFTGRRLVSDDDDTFD